MKDLLASLCRRVVRHADGIRPDSLIPRVGLGIARRPTATIAAQYQPMVCLILQGAKEVTIGDRVLRYDPASYLATSLELPAAGRIVEATPDRPYVAVSLTLRHDLLVEVLSSLPAAPERAVAGFAVTPVTEDLLGSWDSLLALLDAPEDVPVLAPLREREVLYRLLKGPQGDLLRQIARHDSRLSQVRRAVGWIQAHFREPLSVDALARIAGMSVPAFHRNFKAATAMSPLQFQKTLRLQAARQLMAANAAASRAAYAVGYESASQFSREYARMFGAPPSRDAAALRDGTQETTALV